MKLSSVKKRLVPWYTSGDSYYVVGPPGIGKTDTINEAPNILSRALNKNIGAVVIQGPLLTPGDAIGYLMPKHCEDGSIESHYSQPYWFRTHQGKRLSDFDGGIIFVDEMDKADVDVKKVLGECALSGRLGPHRLNGGWVLWGAGNTSDDRSGSTKELDHLINRRRQVSIQFDLDSLLDWMDENGISPLTKSFAATYPEIVCGKKPDKQGPWCTSRSLAKWDKYMQLLAKDNGGDFPDDPDTIEEGQGTIGDACRQYFAHLKIQQEMPKFETIVANPQKAKLPQKADGQMLVCYELAHRVDAKTAAPVVEYIERMPKEFAVTFAKATIKRDQCLLLTPVFQKWTNTNSSLLAVIHH